MSYVIEAKDVKKIYGIYHEIQETGNPMADAVQAVVHEKITKTPYTTALDSINICVEEGDFVCIMGPSGSGKTTLLNVLSTIDKPTKGSVFIQNENIRKMSDLAIGDFRNQYLGFIFQQFNLLENMTIFENIAMPLAIAQMEESQIQEKVMEIAKQVDIESLLDKYPFECSGGQCQRCAVARALVTHPKLIVADEPTGNLDSKNSHEILQLLKKRNEDYQATILLVTHDAMIASYAKRLLFLRDGKIETILERQQLSQKEFYHQIMDVTSKEALAFLDDKR